MPSGPRYERVPLEEGALENSTSVTSVFSNYFTGLSSTAPPSFRSVPESDTQALPHRNDENAATIMPRGERPSPLAEQDFDDPPISLWGSTTTKERDANERRDEILLRLLEAVERLEGRLDAKEVAQSKEEVDLEAANTEKSRRTSTNDMLGIIGCILFAILFLVWLGAIIIIPAVAKYKYAGAVAQAATIGISTASLGES